MTSKTQETVFSKPMEMPAEAPPVEVSFEEFKKVVLTRRSVRVYDGTPIPESVVRECIELALLAPNSSNLQPWEFYWVRSPEKKKRLAEACFSQPAATTAAELIVCVGRPDFWKPNAERMLEKFEALDKPVPKPALDYYRKLAPFIYRQGPLSSFGYLKKLFFWFAGFVRPVPREPLSHSDMRLWAVKSTSLACQNLMLAFRAAGFDTCPMEGYDKARVRKILGLKRSTPIAMVISAGKRSPKGVYGPRVRFESKLFVHEV